MKNKRMKQNKEKTTYIPFTKYNAVHQIEEECFEEFL